MKADPGSRVGDGRPDGYVIVPESFAPPAIYGMTSCESISIKPVSTKVTGALQYHTCPRASRIQTRGPDWGAGVRFSFKTQPAFSSQSVVTFTQLSGIVRLLFHSHWDLLLFGYLI